ncbi:hypothetical protein CYMTET_27373 [Cymbomonas tetramitiformis]|uniref:RING-type domain-containing protein n=1 Tax=Cymbomonas tetramitiformis TaxID=36881 RepID=A0AAE0FQK8_9CHLO|nr:hypothetical protein CYMTET_27373 [Cymbomonas tetramitiformis]
MASGSRRVDRGRGGSGGRGGRGGRGSGSSTSTALLHAAAMQDHWSRELGFSTPSLLRHSKPKVPPHGAPSASSTQRPTASAARELPNRELPNRELDGVEKRPALTLAQRMGIIAKPPTPLTGEQWESVHQQFRDREGEDCECPICREEFKMEDQVLLSCSHVFHRACIRSFERFSEQKCCPVCRLDQYEKRIIHDGQIRFRGISVVRLQKWIRGFLTRRWFTKLLATIPPKDPDERRHWFAGKLQEVNNHLFEEMDATRNEIDELFAEIDARHHEEAVACGQAPRPPTAPLGPILSRPSSPENYPAPVPRRKVSAASPGEINWDKVISLALERGDTECPICIGDLDRRGSQKSWLSCTHVFHFHCITAFERFDKGKQEARDDSHNSREHQHNCPVCRSVYARKEF